MQMKKIPTFCPQNRRSDFANRTWAQKVKSVFINVVAKRHLTTALFYTSIYYEKQLIKLISYRIVETLKN